MPLLILLLLIGLPLAEISVFIEVGSEIGAGYTIMLTIATAIVGLAVARIQGFMVMVRMQESMARGQPPVGELVHGFFLFFGGVFLFIPGFLTDAVGILLLLPPVRVFLGRAGLQSVLARKSGADARRNDGGGGKENVEIEGVFWSDETNDPVGGEPLPEDDRKD